MEVTEHWNPVTEYDSHSVQNTTQQLEADSSEPHEILPSLPPTLLIAGPSQDAGSWPVLEEGILVPPFVLAIIGAGRWRSKGRT